MKEKSIAAFELASEYSLYGLIFFLPISKAMCELLFGIALFAFICKKFLKPDFNFLRDYVYLFLFLFIFFNALSLLNSGPLLAKSIRALFGKWLKFTLVFAVTADTLNTHKRIHNFITVFILSSVLVCIDGFFQYVYKIDFLRYRHIIGLDSGTYGITATFNHYNNLGGYLVMAFCVYIGIFLKAKPKNVSYRILMLIPVPMLLFCLSLSYSRGAVISLVFVLLIMVGILFRTKEVVAMLIVLAIALIAMLPLREKLFDMFEPGGDSQRLIIWKGTWLMIKENIFLGKGVGTYMDHFSEFVPNLSVRYAHNCYLQMWAEAGIFALLSFLFFTGSVLKKALFTIKKHRDYLLLGLFCGIVGFLFHSFFDTHFYSLQLSYLFWINLGALSSLTRIIGTKDISRA